MTDHDNDGASTVMHESDDTVNGETGGEERADESKQPETAGPAEGDATEPVADGGGSADPTPTEDEKQSAKKPSAKKPPAEDSSTEQQPSDHAATAPGMRWYVLRVASNREDQVREALLRKIKIEGLDERIGRILVLTQREKRMRGGVAKVFDRKLYPGYVFVEMGTDEDGTIPDDVWYVIKETIGVGDFIGSDGKPSPMKTHDVEQMLGIVEKAAEQPTLAGMAGMKKGDPIKVKDGPFENFEGEIDEVFPDKGQVRVVVTIFGRATPIDLEYWQIEQT